MNFVEKPAFMYNSGIFLVWPNLNESEICLQGWQIHTPLSKALYYWTPPWIPGCRLLCKMVNFCWINIAVCCLWWCLYNLLCCWKMLFLESLSYCFLLVCGPAVLARPEDTYFRGSGDWKLMCVNSHRFFRNLLLWARPMHTYSVVLYSMKLKIMWIMIFTTFKEAGFLVCMSMLAKLIEIKLCHPWCCVLLIQENMLRWLMKSKECRVKDTAVLNPKL